MARVFKKLLQIAATAGLLTAGYLGYVRAFALVASSVGPPRVVPMVPPGATRNASAEQADALAVRAFGEEHWTVRPDEKGTPAFRYYSTDRGYWLFFRDYERKDEGKRLRLSPFAVIWKDRGRNGLKTLLAEEATVEFDKPFDFGRPGGAARIVAAKVEREVLIRDDKGTPDPADDLRIGPLAELEFDGQKDQITSRSRVILKDRDLITATAVGMRIDLRPRDGLPQSGGVGSSHTGYTGARTLYLLRNVYIKIADLGRAGAVPGATTGARPKGPRPGDIQCDDELRLDLPRPRLRPWCGPPEKSDPTFAHFYKNVKVRQGDPDRPDQLDADRLDLVLVPAEDLPSSPEVRAEADAKAQARLYTDPAAGPKGAPEEEGMLTNLVLVEARATGHAVWLQSPTQGAKGRGNELHYRRGAPVAPDVVYFRGDQYTDIEKVNLVTNGPRTGEVQSVDRIRTTDVTIHQRPGGAARIVARGPGRLDTRSEQNGPVEQSAWWRDELEVQSYLQEGEERRKVTLKGEPGVLSPTQGEVRARDSLVAFLRPRLREPDRLEADGRPVEPAGAESADARRGYRIDRVEGHNQVRMITSGASPEPGTDPDIPSGRKTIFARTRLDVLFEEPPPAPKSASAAPAPAGRRPAPEPEFPEPTPSPALVAKPGEPADPGEGEAERPKKRPEPNMDVAADTIWAVVLQRPGGGGPTVEATPTDAPADSSKAKGSLKQARLRGEVAIHQGPTPGKTRGTDVTADKVDLFNVTDKALAAKDAAADPSGRPKDLYEFYAHGTGQQPAVVATEEMTIRGPILGLDQAKDYAWCDGAGRLTQHKGGSLLGQAKVAQVRPEDEDIADPAEGEKPRREPGPMDLTWASGMKFFGRPTEAQWSALLRDYKLKSGGGERPAVAEFRGRVHGENPESSLDCGRMLAFLDRPFAFARPARDPDDPDAPGPEPRPQIVRVRCFDDVSVVNRKLDPESAEVVEKQRVVGQDVLFDKPTGHFNVQGAGVVYHYGRGKPEDDAASPNRPQERESGRPATAAVPGPNTTTRLRPVADARDRTGAQGQGTRDKGQATKAKLGPLELTRISFDRSMVGRFTASEFGGVAGRPARPGPRDADFFGGIQVLRANVPGEDGDLDADDPPDEFMLMSSLKLHMSSEPAPKGAKESSYTFLRAEDDAKVRTRDKAIRADRICYNSTTRNLYMYGDRHDVTVIQQAGTAQQTSYARGRHLYYNVDTKRVELLDPQGIQLIDANTTGRAYPAKPEKEKPEKKPKRYISRPTRSDKERRAVNGK